MKIISHRGYWQTASEKNTKVAFERSFSLGYGTETDLRDHNSRVVISHDMAHQASMPAEVFFEIYKSFGKPLPLALNVKADGLQNEVERLLKEYEIDNYFLFDMAVPDGVLYIRMKLNAYTRQSEFEPTPAYYDSAAGVWLDEFEDHWISKNTITQHRANGKAVCIVSPELHGRDQCIAWEHYRDLEKDIGGDYLMLCTDMPEKAHAFFNQTTT
jgi:hypothetical protein